MLIEKIIDELEKRFPLFLQEEYDNSGVQIAGPNVEVECAMVSLDATPQGISLAVASGCQLFLTHHPLLFFPLKKVTPDDTTGKMLYTVIMNSMTLYSMHTNYDSAPGGLNDALCQRLGLSKVEPLVADERLEGSGMGRIGEIEGMEIREFASFVKSAFDVQYIRMAPKGPHMVRKVAICSGAGASLIDEAVKSGADVYITGDVTYHEIIHAVNSGLSMLVVEHDETEKFFEDEMKKLLSSWGVRTLTYHEKFYHYV